MKSINELDTDEFLDCIVELSPIIPFILEMESIQSQLSGNYNEKIKEQQRIIRQHAILIENATPAQKIEYQSKINEATEKIKKESAIIYTRDIASLLPFLSNKENRGCIYSTMGILMKTNKKNIAKYPPNKFIYHLKKIIFDSDFKTLFIYSDDIHLTE